MSLLKLMTLEEITTGNGNYCTDSACARSCTMIFFKNGTEKLRHSRETFEKVLQSAWEGGYFDEPTK